MPGVEPVQSGGNGISGGAAMAIFVGVLVLVGVSAWFLIPGLTDTEVATTPSTLNSTMSTLNSTTLPPPPTITGEVAIETSFDSATAVLFGSGDELVGGKPCAAINNDGDIRSGARMTATDINGKLIGVGSVLGNGVLALKPGIEDRTVPTGSSAAERKEFVYANADCVFSFTIPLVHEAEFYTIAVGDGDGVTYSHLEMVSFGWFPEQAQ
jgi:hypothetical protein